MNLGKNKILLSFLILVFGTLGEPDSLFASPAKLLGSQNCSIALIGDSLSTSFFLSGKVDNVVRARSRGSRDHNWFFETSTGQGSVASFSKFLYSYLGQIVPTLNLANVGAYVPGVDVKPSFRDLVLGSRNLREQSESLARKETSPCLTLSWIGHNNLDYRTWEGVQESTPIELRALFQEHARVFAKAYIRSLRPLLTRLVKEPEHAVIVVFGMVNFRSYFEARERIEEERVLGTYPYLEESEATFVSMSVQHRKGLIELAERVNQQLQLEVELTARAIPSHVRLIYSPALSEVDIHFKEALHPSDAWHSTRYGHDLLARKVFFSEEILNHALPFLLEH